MLEDMLGLADQPLIYIVVVSHLVSKLPIALYTLSSCAYLSRGFTELLLVHRLCIDNLRRRSTQIHHPDLDRPTITRINTATSWPKMWKDKMCTSNSIMARYHDLDHTIRYHVIHPVLQSRISQRPTVSAIMSSADFLSLGTMEHGNELG